MSVIIASAAQRFTDTFVPIEVRKESITYVRISAFGSVFGAIDFAVSCATRALDRYVCAPPRSPSSGTNCASEGQTSPS